ncbi:MAG: metallophosphatase family protein [Duncaniella sp.]|nr:metallophosphatase family protein [Duncaniella sp.]
MKTIGILSDTHSYLDPEIARHFKDCDEIWHAGDIGDADVLRQLSEMAPTVRAVSGNVDHGEVRRRCPELMIFETGGVKVLLTHIGGYPGKWGRGMSKLIADNSINLVVDGHSHILKVMPDPALGVLLVNPGAAGRQGWQKVRTIVRLTIDDNEVKTLDVIHL